VAFIPDAGDIVWLEFAPQAGREQSGRRPALVLSPASYNGKTSLMLCCPLTTRIKDYPFEVPIAGEPRSVVLADHVKNPNWVERKASFKARASPGELADVRKAVRALVGEP
jgi:mRNA interferase MazF